MKADKLIIFSFLILINSCCFFKSDKNTKVVLLNEKTSPRNDSIVFEYKDVSKQLTLVRKSIYLNKLKPIVFEYYLKKNANFIEIGIYNEMEKIQYHKYLSFDSSAEIRSEFDFLKYGSLKMKYIGYENVKIRSGLYKLRKYRGYDIGIKGKNDFIFYFNDSIQLQMVDFGKSRMISSKLP